VRTERRLLPGPSPRVEGACALGTAERAVGEPPAVLTRERNALRHALVDDVDADQREPVHVRLARAEIAALDRVVEQALNAVAVVLVILRRVDPPLCGDRVRSARRILIAVAADVVSELAEGGGRGAA